MQDRISLKTQTEIDEFRKNKTLRFDDNPIVRIIKVAALAIGVEKYRTQCGYFQISGRDEWIWFANCTHDGQGWINELSSKGEMIIEKKLDKNGCFIQSENKEYVDKIIEQNHNRVVFVKESEKGGFRFIGLFKIDVEASRNKGMAIYTRYATEFTFK